MRDRAVFYEITFSEVVKRLLHEAFIVSVALAFIATGYAQPNTPSPTATPNQNCIIFNAEDFGGNKVALTYQCDFSVYDYSGVPVDIYLGATVISASTSSSVVTCASPTTSSSVTCTSPGACSVADFLNSGDVYIFDKRFRPNKYTGKVEKPTWSAVSFPPVPTSGSGIIGVPSDLTGRFGVVLIRSSNGEFIRTDGLPVEMTDCVSPSTSSSAIQAMSRY